MSVLNKNNMMPLCRRDVSALVLNMLLDSEIGEEKGSSATQSLRRWYFSSRPENVFANLVPTDARSFQGSNNKNALRSHTLLIRVETGSRGFSNEPKVMLYFIV